MSETEESTEQTGPLTTKDAVDFTHKAEHAPDDRLTRKQASAYLGISLSRLAQHRRAGLIEYVERNRVTREVWFLFRDVEKLREYREGQLDFPAGRTTS